MSYKVQEMFEWFSQFEKEDIRIQGETKVFDVEIRKRALPHLLGLQYMNKEEKKMDGYRLYRYVTKGNFSDKDILKQVRKNNFYRAKDVKNRISTFQEFLENIEKSYIVEKTNDDSKIKSNYLVIQSKKEMILHLGIRTSHVGDSIEDFEVFSKKGNYLETFLVQNNNNYFENTKILEKVQGIYKYNENTEEFEPFTFSGKEIPRIEKKEKKSKISKKKRAKEGKER